MARQTNLLRGPPDAIDEMELSAGAVEAEADLAVADLPRGVQVLPGASGLHVAVLNRDAGARGETADALDAPLAEAPLALHIQPPELVATEVAASAEQSRCILHTSRFGVMYGIV